MLTGPEGNETSYHYDTDGNLVGVTPEAPLGASSQTVDVLSRLASHTNGKGQTTFYGYDILDRVTHVTYPPDATVATVADLLPRRGDPMTDLNAMVGSIDGLFDAWERDRAAGLGLPGLPLPPNYPKFPGEPIRVPRSRGRRSKCLTRPLGCNVTPGGAGVDAIASDPVPIL